MAANTERRRRALLLATALAPPALAADVACHLTYGGENRTVSARPTTAPHAVAPVAVGSFFLFRVIFRQEPADLAGIKLYTYVDRDEGPTLIHQASYPYPPPAAVPGFTGSHLVYEPLRDSELQYWCELKDAS